MLSTADASHLRGPDDMFADCAAVIFDVEGTLVDAVLPTLRSWCETLAEFGFRYDTADLRPFSGMDGGEMLEQLIGPEKLAGLKENILTVQGHRYREKHLHEVQPFPCVKQLVERMRAAGIAVAIATSCQPDELRRYSELMQTEGLFDAIACGEDADKGKPHPDILLRALERLGVEAAQAIMVGDSPYDAMAAQAAGMRSAGVLTGHFPARELREAGCAAVFRNPADLLRQVQDLPRFRMSAPKPRPASELPRSVSAARAARRQARSVGPAGPSGAGPAAKSG